MAITLHALTEDFNMINMTLEVEPLQGKNTRTYIMENMIDGESKVFINGESKKKT